MTDSRQILWITTIDRARITDVSGVDAAGQPWTMTQADAVAVVESGATRFYANVWGRPVWVVVATNGDGAKILKTETDGARPHNLLTLPERPAS